MTMELAQQTLVQQVSHFSPATRAAIGVALILIAIVLHYLEVVLKRQEIDPGCFLEFASVVFGLVGATILLGTI